MKVSQFDAMAGLVLDRRLFRALAGPQYAAIGLALAAPALACEVAVSPVYRFAAALAEHQAAMDAIGRAVLDFPKRSA